MSDRAAMQQAQLDVITVTLMREGINKHRARELADHFVNFTLPPPLPVQEPAAYDKTEMNSFVIDLYDKKMQEGKHGHYETMFYVVHQAIKRASPPLPVQPERKLLTVTTILNMMPSTIPADYDGELMEFARAVEAKLKENT